MPEFLSGIRKQEVVQGRAAKFECDVIGTPAPEITWFKGVRELHEGDPKYSFYREGETYTLVVNDVYGEDADEYQCRASNRAGSRTSRADLIIKCKSGVKVKVFSMNQFFL